jgi:hypothetical protein
MRWLSRAAFVVLSAVCAPSAAAQGEPQLPVVHALIFGDASYVLTDRRVAATGPSLFPLPGGFALGQLVGHVNAALNDRLTFFGEGSATAQTAGYSIEVERSILRYDFSDAVKLSVGRYHTPIGYWNTAFHHGAWLQTTESRPEMIKFGSQLLPTHFVGAFAEGNVPSGDLGLGYMLGVGNGRGATISRGSDAMDVNGSRAWTASVFARPTSLYGVQVGAGYYRDRVSPGGVSLASEGITSTYVAWERERPEFLAEYATIRHSPIAGGPTTSSHASYAQFAYRLSGDLRAFKPYVRAERISTAAGDVIFAPLSLGYKGFTAGARFDFAAYAALKAEYRREEFQNTPWSNGLHFQASFTVPDLFGGDHTSMHE